MPEQGESPVSWYMKVLPELFWFENIIFENYIEL